MDFFLQGKTYHAVLRDAAGLKELLTLEETLWVATSAQVTAFRMDAEFLKLLDNDQDQRIKAGEFRAALKWTLDVLADVSGLEQGASTLYPSALRTETPDGEKIRTLLERIRGDEPTVTLAKIRGWRQRLEGRPVSEAGVVLPEAAEREAVRQWMLDVLAVTPGTPHPSGKAGLDETALKSFEENAKRRLDWLARAESDEVGGRSEVCPLGEATEAAFAIYRSVRESLDRFFALCDLCSLDPDAADRFWPGVPDAPLAAAEEVVALLRQAPVAKPNPEGLLRLDARVNPAYARDLHEFRARIVIPLFDKTDEVFSRADWRRVREAMEQHAAWKAEEPAPAFAPLSAGQLRALAESPHLAAVRELIRTQTTATLDLQQVRLAEKLALFQANLLTFANNFVSFPHLYNAGDRAAFEEGTLLMDARRFNLAVRVPDRAQYLKNIEGGTMFILILRLEHPERPDGMDVAVPVTAGRKGNLRVGKHGIFQDVKGREWFATITHICDNPVSLTEAMAAPFLRLGSAFSKKVESITQSAEKKLDQSTDLLNLSGAPPAAPPPPPPPAASAGSGQLLAGGGIAVAAMGSSLAFMTKTFSGLSLMQVIGGLFVAVLAVLVPSALIAALRLSRRDMSVLLEGAGWAVNSHMRLSRAQCLAFTSKPAFPKDSRFRRDREWWLRRALLITLLLYLLSRLFW